MVGSQGRKKTTENKKRNRCLKLAMVIGLPTLAAASDGATLWSKYHTANDVVILQPSSLSKQKTDPQTASSNFENKVLIESDRQVRDPKLSTIKSFFSQNIISRAESNQKLSKMTKMKIRKYIFDIKDQFGLTSTKRMYAFFYIPVILPSEKEGDKDLGEWGSNHVFDTHASTADDGRVKALANYILTREKVDPSKPEDAVKAIAWWVMNNVTMDVKNRGLSAINYTNETQFEKDKRSMGVGVTHHQRNSERIILSSGVCIDMTNLAADLLNSIGIPSRSLAATASGLPENSFNSKALRRIGHSLLQVYLHSGTSYYDLTPRFNKDEHLISNKLIRVNKPNEYILDRFGRRYPDLYAFRIGCFASIPVERFAGFPKIKAIIDQDVAAGHLISEMFLQDKAGLRKFLQFWEKVEKEVRIYFNDEIMNAMGYMKKGE